jgi:hypothetical protein
MHTCWLRRADRCIFRGGPPPRPPPPPSPSPSLPLLPQATLHSALGTAVAASSRSEFATSAYGVPTLHPAALVRLSRAAVAHGPALVVGCGYALLLFNCDIGLLGGAYLCALLLAFILPPQRGAWVAVGGWEGPAAVDARQTAMSGVAAGRGASCWCVCLFGGRWGRGDVCIHKGCGDRPIYPMGSSQTHSPPPPPSLAPPGCDRLAPRSRPPHLPPRHLDPSGPPRPPGSR